MDKNQTFKHLSPEERAAIMIEQQRGTSIRQMACMLGRSPSTVSRELRRSGDSPYNASAAASHYQAQRLRCRAQRKLDHHIHLRQYVERRLLEYCWSPQQIAARLRGMPEHKRPDHQLVSHEAIYQWIYAHPRGALKKEMVQMLRQSKPARGRRRTTLASQRSFVPEDLRIHNRPAEIEERLIPGHWEGDFIKGAYNRSAIGVLSERKTRFVILCRMDGCTAEDALEGFTRQMKRLPSFLRSSLTYDRGSEMACFSELSKRLKMDIWFCDPHAPWQRGSNENTNGLLRQFFPKGMDLSNISQTRLNDVARLLNGRPRQTLGWETPEEVMTQVLDEHARSSVAIDC